MSNGSSNHVAEARELFRNKDYDAAVTTLRDALENDSSDRTGWEMLGVLLFRLKRHDEAAETFRQLTRLNPREAGAWVNLGAVLNILHDFKGAIIALRKAIQRDKACSVAYYNLAIAQKGQRQPNVAISAYEECLKLDPANTQASVGLVKLLLEQNQPSKASKVVTAALESAPNSEKLQRLRLQAEAGMQSSQLKLPPLGRLVDEKELARSQTALRRRELSPSDRNREREFMREAARELRRAVRPMLPILDEALPKHMRTLHLVGTRQDTRHEAAPAFEELVSTISHLAGLREQVVELVTAIRSHLKKTDPEN